MDNKYLKLARSAREDKNSEDAKKYYDMLRVDDPDNAEAKFFSPYYALYEGKNGEVPTRFNRVCNALEGTIKAIVAAEDNSAEKLEVLKAVVDAFVPITSTTYKFMINCRAGDKSIFSMSERNEVCRTGILALYNLGDLIERELKLVAGSAQCAVCAWKEGVAVQQKWYGVVKDKTLPETYAAKIKKIEPSYEMPKKGGCIQFG